MDKWIQAILKQAYDDKGWMDRALTAKRARDRDSEIKMVVLPETVTIKIVIYLHKPYGSYIPGIGDRRHVKPDKELILKTTTTVGAIKECLLENLPNLEYNRLEIEYDGEDLSDDVTIQQISNKWQYFMTNRYLNLHVYCRKTTFMRIYQYFIDQGISQEIAKNQTNTFEQFFKDKHIYIRRLRSKNKAKILAETIMDTLKKQNMSDELQNEMRQTIIGFLTSEEYIQYKNNYQVYMNPFGENNFATNVGTNKEEAKETPTNNIVDTFQNKKAKNQMETFQNRDSDTNVGISKENKTIKQDNDKIVIFQDNDTSMDNEQSITGNKDEIDTCQRNGVYDSMGNENTKKQAKNMGLSDENAHEQFDDLQDALMDKIIARHIEIKELLNICRARLLYLISILQQLPPSPDQE